MTRHQITNSLRVALFLGICAPLFAQDSAPSSHLVFNDNFDGDIIINEVRIPKDGEALYTYYEALGWRGKGAGYAGLQAHPRAHNFIFSIWDHKDHTAPIKAVHRGPGTETKGFGGEGTGLKSWNFELGWKTDTWYTLVARTWPVDDHTFYGFWVRAGDTQKWTHLVTMDVAIERGRFRGGTDAFIEDWLSTGKNARTSHLRAGWKRKTDGKWFPFGQARYSVNKWDLDEGKRSFDRRTAWNGGTKRLGDEPIYFMTSGGDDTKPETENPSQHAIARKEDSPKFKSIRLSSSRAKFVSDGMLEVSWEVEPLTLPQFGYRIQISNSETGEVLATTEESAPHVRKKLIDLSAIKAKAEQHVITLECTDIFDGKTKAEIGTSPAPASK